MLFVLVVSLAGCSKSESTAPAAQTSDPKPSGSKPAKDPATARKLIAEGAFVLDVRTPDEYAAGHLANAANVPIQEFAQRMAEVEKLAGADKARPVVVYCAAGGRATKAKQQLEAAGYTNVVNGGGFDDLR